MTRHWSRILALPVGLTLLICFMAACGSGTTSTTGTPSGTVTIKIGSEFPTSAKDASAGLPAQNGIALAVQEANQSNLLPGYKFVLVAKDDVGADGQHDSTVGQKNVNDLIGDAEVAGIIGPLNSSVALAEMPAANNAPIALISPANTNDCLTQNTPASECGGANSKLAVLRPTGKVTYFRTATLDQYQGGALAGYAYKTKGYKTAYVIDDTEAYGAGLATNFISDFQKDGGTLLGHRSIASTESYESVLTEIASTKPDVVFFGGNDSTGAITIRQQMVRVAGLANTPFMVGDGSVTSAFAQAIKSTGGGPVFGTIPGADPSEYPASKTFTTNYQKTYGNTGAYSYGGFDDANILLNAIKTVVQNKTATVPTSSSDSADATAFRQAVINAVQKTNYNGVTGPQAFDSNGDTTNRQVSVYTIASSAGNGNGWSFLKGVDPTKP